VPISRYRATHFALPRETGTDGFPRPWVIMSSHGWNPRPPPPQKNIWGYLILKMSIYCWGLTKGWNIWGYLNIWGYHNAGLTSGPGLQQIFVAVFLKCNPFCQIILVYFASLWGLWQCTNVSRIWTVSTMVVYKIKF